MSGGTEYQPPLDVMRAEIRAEESRLAKRAAPPAGTKEEMALIRIREILDRPPQAYDTQKIQAEIAGILGPYAYKPWPRLKP